MTYLGLIPTKTWNIVLTIAREEQDPIPQPENCPYVILTRPAPQQLLALCGRLKKQLIELSITEITPPNLKQEDRLPLSDDNYDDAQAKADTLLERAILSQTRMFH